MHTLQSHRIQIYTSCLKDGYVLNVEVIVVADVPFMQDWGSLPDIKRALEDVDPHVDVDQDGGMFMIKHLKSTIVLTLRL